MEDIYWAVEYPSYILRCCLKSTLKIIYIAEKSFRLTRFCYEVSRAEPNLDFTFNPINSQIFSVNFWKNFQCRRRFY